MGGKQLPACPVEVTLTLISNKWKILIMRNKKIWKIKNKK